MKVEELKSYVSPMVEVVAVAVEKGFAGSVVPPVNAPEGGEDY